ncbi:MAG: phospholipase D family protein [Myxococcales bacterium]|nr:phospholipase D family protein [Myxococcales bacterium]MCB9754475.1 phospholipase D family protein [Myxococcales bacterium]
MELVANAVNGRYFTELIERVRRSAHLESIRAAVAYVNDKDSLVSLAKDKKVPLSIYALFDGEVWPSLPVLKYFAHRAPPSIQLFLTAKFYHPKVYWFEGVGAYIGSANLTDGGWIKNIESGIWLDTNELDAQGLEDELRSMFDVIAERSVFVNGGHIKLAERIRDKGVELARMRKQLDTDIAEALAGLPGWTSPIDRTKRTEPGGAAKKAFIREWNETLGLLHMLTRIARDKPGPSWVSPDAHPAIVQDQATELWYNLNIRKVGQDQIEVLHRRNRARPEAAIDEVFAGWQALGSDDERWQEWVNEVPRRLGQLLTRESLHDLSVDTLGEIINSSHAFRAHGRQMTNRELGLPGDAQTPIEQRCHVYAEYLLAQRTAADRGVAQVLEHALWGDRVEPDCAERLWRVTQDPEWRLPHLGIHTLAELLGYARPDEYPPRNNRVRKTLRALGFEQVRL